jgi:4-hydroxy-tetrahydrodipicolinate synthase
MKGVYVLPPTPFKKDGSFDEENLRENVRKLAEAGVDAVITTGSVGEFHTITWEDHKRLIKALSEATKENGIKGVAGCSGVNTDEAIKKVKFAEECGADAIMTSAHTMLTSPKGSL